MIKIWELSTKNGRTFRVVIENKNQELRLKKVIAENKNKEYETFNEIKVVNNGIHTISQLEKLALTLQ